jgi:hypothetical protein
VYQAHGGSSSPRPKFPFAAVGVKESRTPEPMAPSQPNQGAAISTNLTTASTGLVTTTQPITTTTTTNPYQMRIGGGVGGGTSMTGGYPPQPVPQPGHTAFGHGGYAPPVTQPLGTHGSAIMQPSTETYTPSTMPGIMQPGVPGMPQPGGGGVVSGSLQPGRETTYPVDAPVTWNDPPIIAKKVHICTVLYVTLCTMYL